MVLSKGVTISGKPLKDHVEALNLAVAWERVKQFASSGKPLGEPELLDLHRITLTRVEDSHAGQYRSGAVRISGSSHVPPNAIKVPELMEALFADLRATPDPIEKAAKIHHGIASIHPFADGNGRAARLAMNFVLIAAGYPPVSISTDLRADYYQALEAADSGDVQAWIDFTSRQVEDELDRWLAALEDARQDKQGT